MKLIPIRICLLASNLKESHFLEVFEKNLPKIGKCSNDYSNRTNRSVTVLATMPENFKIVLLAVFFCTPLAKGYGTPCINL